MCQHRTLAQRPGAKIHYCDQCETYNVWYNNLLISFDEIGLEEFKNQLSDCYDYHLEHRCERHRRVRDITFHTPVKGFHFVFSTKEVGALLRLIQEAQISILLRCLLIPIFCALQFCLLAQEQTELDSIWKTYDLDDVVVTAQYAPTSAENAIHTVKVIKAEDIQAQGQINLSDVLTNQLNLRVNTDPILGNGLQIQGIGGENIQILIDGVPVIGRVGGDIDLSQINLQNIQRIEIIEGAMSAQYGSNAAGGVINLITKKSQLNKWQVQSQNQYESIGILNNSLTLGYQGNRMFFSVTGARNDYQFDDIDSLRLLEEVEVSPGNTIETRITPWNPKTQFNLDAMLRFRYDDSLNITLQHRRFHEELIFVDQVRRPDFLPYAFDEFYTTKRNDYSLNIEHYLGSGLYVNSTLAYNYYEREKKTERLDFEPDTTSLVPGGQDTAVFTTILHRSIISTTDNKRLSGQLGLEFLRDVGKGDRIIDESSAPLNEATMTNVATWLSLRYNILSNLTAQANLRVGYNSKYDHPVIPSFHLNWQPLDNWKVKLNYAHGFRAPTLKELHFNFIDINHYIIGNPDLKAEHSQNASLTVDYKNRFGEGHELKITSKLFYNDITDRIILAEFEPFRFNYQNVAKFETHGLNLQGTYSYKDQLSLTSGLAYTRLYNRISESTDADKFIGVFEMQNELSCVLPGTTTRLVLVHRLIGQLQRFYEDSEGNLQEGFIGRYQLLNGVLSQSFWKDRLFVSAGVNNILDVESVPLTGGQTGSAHSVSNGSRLIDWGRTWFVRFNVTL